MTLLLRKVTLFYHLLYSIHSKEITMHIPHLVNEGGVIFHLLEGGVTPESFEILLHRRFVCSPPFI